MSKIPTHYDNLKISRDAPEELIRSAYKILIQHYHPENFSGQEDEALELVAVIRDSYEILIDPIRRAEHDLWIDEQEELAIQHSQWLFDCTLESALQAAHQSPSSSGSTAFQSAYLNEHSCEADAGSIFPRIDKHMFKNVLNVTVMGLVLLIALYCFKNGEIDRNFASLKTIPIELFKPIANADHHS